jgi:Na+/melibiose symporter-like transporter
MIIAFFYPLNDERVQQIVNELEERRKAIGEETVTV